MRKTKYRNIFLSLLVSGSMLFGSITPVMADVAEPSPAGVEYASEVENVTDVTDSIQGVLEASRDIALASPEELQGLQDEIETVKEKYDELPEEQQDALQGSMESIENASVSAEVMADALEAVSNGETPEGSELENSWRYINGQPIEEALSNAEEEAEEAVSIAEDSVLEEALGFSEDDAEKTEEVDQAAQEEEIEEENEALQNDPEIQDAEAEIEDPKSIEIIDGDEDQDGEISSEEASAVLTRVNLSSAPQAVLVAAAGTTRTKGIDVSHHNGDLDWSALQKAGVKYAIIRCCQGSAKRGYVNDRYWTANVAACEKLGIPYGVYIYSKALSTAELDAEVAQVLEYLDGHKPTFPVYFDAEDNAQGALGEAKVSELAERFCKKIKEAGYKAGVYANTSWFNTRLTSFAKISGYYHWIAQYPGETYNLGKRNFSAKTGGWAFSRNPSSTCGYGGYYETWQYASNGYFDGAYESNQKLWSNFDLNYWYGTLPNATTTSATYTVSFNGNGATSGSMSNQAITSGKATALKANAFKKDGYVFVGWDTQADGKGTGYADKASVKDLATAGKSITLYAVWKKTGMSVDEVAREVMKDEWSTGETRRQRETAAGYDYNAVQARIGQLKEITVTFKRNFSDSDTTSNVQTFDFGASGQSFSAKGWSRPGYYLDGWSLDKDATAGKWKVTSGVNNNWIADYSPNVTLYAVWKPYKLTIRYHAGTATDDAKEVWDGKSDPMKSTNYLYDAENFAVNGLPNANGGKWNLTQKGYAGTDIWMIDNNASRVLDADTKYATVQALASAAKVDISKSDETLDLYAKMAPVSYSVKFDGNGATSGTMANETFVYDTAKALTANTFAKKGAVFTGWNTKADGTGTAYADKASVKNLTDADGGKVTLYAQWKANSYTVTYNGNGGSTPASQSGNVGAALNGTSTRDGYTFDGWYDAANGGNKITSIQTKNMTVYAHWKANAYVIAFDGNGSTSGFTVKLAMTYDTAKNLTANGFVRTGYQFTGWNTKANGTGTAYTDKASVKNLTKTSGSTVTLYAQWKAVYKVTYDANGGAAPAAQTAEAGTKLSGTTSRKGYTFNGWYTAATGGTKVTTVPAANATYYAHWTANPYTIVFDANSGAGKMASIGTKYDAQVTLRPNAFWRYGYIFEGWNTRADGKGTAYKDGASVKNLRDDEGETVRLYAQWKAVSFKTSVTADDIVDVMVGWIGIKEGTAKHRAIIDTYNAYNPKNTQYRVTYKDAWCDATVSAAFIKENAVNLIGAVDCGVERHVGVFKDAGIWTENRFATPKRGDLITFNWSAKATTEEDDLHGDHIGIVEYVKDGKVYTIEGNSSDMVQRKSYSIGDARIRGYARPFYSTERKYKVTYNGNGGTTPGTQTDYAGTALNGTSTRDGYTFAGWYTAASGGSKVTTIPKDNVTYYAHWTANQYTIRFNGNGSTSGKMADQTATYDKDITLRANSFKKTGYTFLGWCVRADEKGAGYTNKMSVKNLTDDNKGVVTLYACWYKKGDNKDEKDIDKVAYEVINRFWGVNADRKTRLTNAGYDYVLVQQRVSEIMLGEDKTSNVAVKFVGNGATSGSTASQSIKRKTATALRANGYKRTGYTFKGWNTKANGKGTAYKNKQSVKLNENLVLYAQWKKK